MKRFHARLLFSLLLPLVLQPSLLQAGEARKIRIGKDAGSDVPVWLETSLKRVFPNTPAGAADLNLVGARNGKISFQAAIRNTQLNALHVKCEIVGADDMKPLVRWVGLVPMPPLTIETDPSELDGINSLPALVRATEGDAVSVFQE